MLNHLSSLAETSETAEDMHRNVSVTTHLLKSQKPPRWFVTLFYICFIAWVSLQAATEYFTVRSLYTYTHLPLFQPEKQVDSAFLNIVAVGLLTVLVVLTFLYGIVRSNKVALLASAAFLGTLLILNSLAVGILMSSKFGLNTGPMQFGQRVLSIYHPNVSSAHWFAELDRWAEAFPLPAQPPEPATSAPESIRLRQAQESLLYLLDFFQRKGGCCGVNSHGDYERYGAAIASSCRCLEEAHGRLQPDCTAERWPLVDGTTAPLWSRGCQPVVQGFLVDLYYLRDLLASTVVFQLLVFLLGVILGLNTPPTVDDDENGREGTENGEG